MTTTSVRTDNVEKLNGGNFNRWKLQISLILEASDLWDVVTGDEAIPGSDDAKIKKWKKKDVQARSIIVPTLDAAQTSHIYSCKTSKEMFDKLAAANSDSSSLNKQHTTTKFLNYQMKRDQSPVQAMMEIEDLVRSLAEMKVVLDESTVITKVVTALPDAYDAFKTAWDSVPESSQSREMLMSRLKKEELKRKVTPVGDSESAETTRAFYAPQRSGSSKSEEKFNGNSKKVIECFKCGGPHFKRNCPELKQKDETRRKDSPEEDSWRESSWRDNSKTDNSRKDNFWKDDSRREDSGDRDSKKANSFHSRMAFMGKSGHSVPYNGIDWISDSGASQHICGDLALFSDYTPFLTERQVLMTDNRTIQVEGRGTVILEAYIQGRWEECTVNDVLYIPGAANLFSEGTMASKGFRIVRDSQTTTFKDRDGRGPIADFTGGVYVMRFRPVRKVHSAFLTHVEQPVLEKQDHHLNSLGSVNLVKKVQMEKGTQTMTEKELFGEVQSLELEIDDWFDALEAEDWFDALEAKQWFDAVTDDIETGVDWSDALEESLLPSFENGSRVQRSTGVIFNCIIQVLIVFVCLLQSGCLKGVKLLVEIGGKLFVEFPRIGVETRQEGVGGNSKQLCIATHLVSVDFGTSTTQLPSTSKMKGKLPDHNEILRSPSG
jgi:hypothetical protein